MIGVSVIIPNYNHVKFLQERIESVLNQTSNHYELILLDDFSTDGSQDIIKNYSNHSRVSHTSLNDANTGSPFSQWAKGIRIAKFDWIWIAESDDIAEPTFLERLIEKITSEKGIGLAYSDSCFFGSGHDGQSTSITKNKFFNTSKWTSDYIVSGKEELKNNLSEICTINNASACIFNKNLVLNELKTLEKYKTCGDWYLYQVIASKAKIAYVSQTLNKIRIHGANTSIQILKEKGLPFQEDYFRLLKASISLTSVSYSSRYNFMKQHLLVNSISRYGPVSVIKFFFFMVRLTPSLFIQYLWFNCVYLAKRVTRLG
jgi:glycosyltransferase involved in cell wall biosynthesis